MRGRVSPHKAKYDFKHILLSTVRGLYKNKMANHKAFKVQLRYGTTDGTNLPFIPGGRNFVIGYNSKYGLVRVTEGKGDVFFEGRVSIRGLLSRLQPGSQNEVNSQVEDFIMKSYHNFWDYQKHPNQYDAPPTPMLEVLINKN